MIIRLLPAVTWFGGLIRSKDGSLSLTKLGAATFHAGLAFHVNLITFTTGKFDIETWVLYGSFAVGHASFDKATAMVKDYKERTVQAQVTRAEPTPAGAAIGSAPPQG